jgi:hypothetical protein
MAWYDYTPQGQVYGAIGREWNKLTKADYSAGGTADDIAAKQWQFYTDYYLPQEQAMTRQVVAGVPAEYSPDFAAAGMAAAFDKQAGIKARMAQRYGIPTPSNAPDEQQYANQLALIKSAAMAGARNDARNDWRDVNVSRLNAITQLGMGIPAQAMSAANTAQAMNSSMKLSRQLANQGLVNMFVGGALGGAEGYFQAYNSNQPKSQSWTPQTYTA